MDLKNTWCPYIYKSFNPSKKHMWKLITVALLLVTLSTSEVVPFNNDAIEKVFQQKNPALFLFTNGNDASKDAKAALNEVGESAPEGVILTNSDSEDGFGLYDRLAEYLGVDGKAAPQVLFLGAKSEKYRYDKDEINKENLADFIERVKAGEVEQFLKSAPVPESNDEPVKVVVGKTFKEMVLDHEKEVLVKFYAPWCGHCKTLAPHYDAAAKKLLKNPNILIVHPKVI